MVIASACHGKQTSGYAIGCKVEGKQSYEDGDGDNSVGTIADQKGADETDSDKKPTKRAFNNP